MNNQLKLATLMGISFLTGIVVSSNYKVPSSSHDDDPSNPHSKFNREIQKVRVGNNNNVSLAEGTEPNLLLRLSMISEEIRDNPAAVLQKLRNLGHANNTECCALFEIWAETDPKSALETALRPENKDICLMASEVVLGVMLNRSSKAGLELLSTIPPSRISEALSTSFFKMWAAKDTDGLISTLNDIQPKSLRSSALCSLGARLGQINPERGVEWLNQIDDDGERKRALYGLMSGWANTNPEAAAHYFDGLNSSMLSDGMAGMLVNSWSQQDPEAALAWTLNMKGVNNRAIAFSNLALGLSSGLHSPEEIVNFAEKMPVGNARDTVLSTLLYNWKGDDYSGIARLVYSQDSNIVGSAGEAAMAMRWVAIDPQGAREFLSTLGGRANSSILAQEVAKSLVSNNRRDAVEMTFEMLKNSGPGMASAQIDGIVKSDPEAGKELVARFDGTPDSESIKMAFVSSYVSCEPQKTMDWISNNFGGESELNAASFAIRKWMESDQWEASKYVKSLENSPVKDAAMATVAESVAKSNDIKLALSWVVSIQETEMRRNALNRIGNYLDIRNFEKYTEDILESGINSEEIQYLENKQK